jgi:hypothetical protein
VKPIAVGLELDVGDKVLLQLDKRSKPRICRIVSVTTADAKGQVRTRTTKRRKPKP